MTTDYISDLIAPEDFLHDLVKDGKMSLDDAENIMAEKAEKAELEYKNDIERRLAKVHKAPITKGAGADTRWKTRITLDNGTTRQIAKTSLKDLEKALYRHYYQILPPDQSSGETIESLYEEFVDRQIKRRLSSSTIIRYNKDWENHYRNWPAIHKPVSDLTVDECEVWALTLINQKGMTRQNFYNVTGILRGILKLAVNKSLISKNLWEYVDVGNLKFIEEARKFQRSSNEIQNVSTEILQPREMQMLKRLAWERVEASNNAGSIKYLAILFVLNQGLRVGELCAVKYSDLSGDTLHICRMLRDQGMKCREIIPFTKGYRQRMIPLSEESKKVIQYTRNLQEKLGISSDYIFSTDGNCLPYRTPGRALSILCRDLGIPHRHIHSIRKTVITVLVDSDCYTPATIAKIMGNSVSVILKNYYYNREDMDSICSSYETALEDLYGDSERS